MPASGSYTPENYAELDFDWITDHSIVTSRIVEKEWSNDFSEHPLPIKTEIFGKPKLMVQAQRNGSRMSMLLNFIRAIFNPFELGLVIAGKKTLG